MSSLQDKLYNHSQTPPEKVWEKITAALDESHIADQFPATLYAAEVIPPATSWEKITESLNTDYPAITPARQRSFPIFRYAAAAIVIGFIAFGVIKWAGNNKDNSDKENIAVSKIPRTSSKKEINTPVENTATTTDTRNEENIVSQEGEDLVVKAVEIRTNTGEKARKKYVAPQANETDAEPIYAYNELAPANLADRYVMLMTPNGIVRMSKKLSSLVCCVSGEEQDEDCKDQLKKWQEKIACSPVAPSPGNFMDILSLVNSLNNKEL